MNAICTVVSNTAEVNTDADGENVGDRDGINDGEEEGREGEEETIKEGVVDGEGVSFAMVITTDKDGEVDGW